MRDAGPEKDRGAGHHLPARRGSGARPGAYEAPKGAPFLLCAIFEHARQTFPIFKTFLARFPYSGYNEYNVCFIVALPSLRRLRGAIRAFDPGKDH
jgi:hypothetical protein